MRTPIRFLLIAATAATAFAATETPPPFDALPHKIDLSDVRDRQSLVVRTTEPNGVQRNVTAEAKFTLADPAKAKIENGVVTPLADGETKLKVEWNGQSTELQVVVKGAKTEQPVSFRRDVMPVFMTAGCNAGGCHGASRGKDGFELSLFGYNPEGDYFRLTRQQVGRRINLALPEESMLITKNIGTAPHTGGKQFEKDSEMCQTLLRWLEAGAPNDPVDKDGKTTAPECTSIEILPSALLLEGPGNKFKISVRAHFADGTDRDITSMSLFLTSNEASAKIEKDGTIVTGQRGEAFVMARYATHTVGTAVSIIPKGLKYEWPNVEEKNWLDGLVHGKIKALRMLPSGLCDDETFLRRASIDLVGLLPTAGEVKEFVADKNPTKREKKIDTLMAQEGFVDMWALKWSELLQLRSGQNVNEGSYKAVFNYYTWLRERLSKNVPINKVAAELISASGSNLENPAANFFQLETDPLKLAEDTAQAFFGTRIQCAQCHNHPFDRWTMADYRGFVSFFTQIGRKQGEDPRERIIYNSGGGDARHPVTNEVIPPKFLGGEKPDTAGKDRRQVLADWVAAADNPYFPRHIANLIWAQYMGVGIVEPVDDVRISNPPSNQALLDALAAKIVEYNYDLKKIVRDICTSRTYQLTTRPNDTNSLDERNFAKATIRRMRAEVMLDCITQVTETQDKFRGLPLGGRAVQVADGRTTDYFLTTFGRADRLVVCSREEVGPTLSQALHMINGVTIEQKIAAGGVVKKLMEQKLSSREIAAELYLRCFGRQPTEQELVKLEQHWGVTEEQPKVYVDIFWALMNAKEFMFNH
ncbi:MAG: DUF1549 and DUF1553 domain-containing protein [Chthoniobacteraceae bacterium]